MIPTPGTSPEKLEAHATEPGQLVGHSHQLNSAAAAAALIKVVNYSRRNRLETIEFWRKSWDDDDNDDDQDFNDGNDDDNDDDVNDTDDTNDDGVTNDDIDDDVNDDTDDEKWPKFREKKPLETRPPGRSFAPTQRPDLFVSESATCWSGN